MRTATRIVYSAVFVAMSPTEYGKRKHGPRLADYQQEVGLLPVTQKPG